MNVWRKLKALRIGKNKGWRILLAVEAVLLLLGIAGLFGRNETYHFSLEDMTANFGGFSEEAQGCFTDGSDGQAGNLADFAGIALPRGVYRIALWYQTDTNMKNLCTVTDSSLGYKALLTNGEHLYAGLNRTDFLMWLLEDTETLTVHAEYGGEGSLAVKGLTISETNALNRIFLFWVVCLCLLADVCYVFSCYDREYGVSVKDKTVLFGLALVTLFSSLPLMTDYIVNSGDLVYHLMRVEGIKDGILSGQFPVRIAPEWQTGYGYASSIFYGETLLYLMAFFRMAGFTVQGSYRLFFFLVNGATAVLSYWCFARIFKEKYIGLMCSMLYTLSIYRIYKTYGSGSFGETFGVLFLPLVLYGFYRVFTEDTDAPGYGRSWIPLTVGFCGLIQSHLLTCELTGAFTVLLCVILWKRVFRKKTFLVLSKTVIYSSLLSAWFLVPFLDYMATGDFVIQHVSARTIQNRGLFPAHLLTSFVHRGGNVFFDENGMVNSDPTVLGIALAAAFGLWLYLWAFGRLKALDGKWKGLGNIAAVFAVLSAGMSLMAFPWDRLQFQNGLTATLVSSLQFPNRFLTITTLMLTAVAGAAARALWEERKGYAGVLFGGMAALTLISGIFLLNDTLFSFSFVRLYNGEGMGTGYISGAEYLPYGTDPSLFAYGPPAAEENVTVTAYEKGPLSMDTVCSNTSGREGFLELPLLYYKGYRAWDRDSGKPLAVYAGNNNAVGVAVPAGYEGTVRAAFVSPWYWRAAEAVTVLTLLVMVGDGIYRKRGSRRGNSSMRELDPA